MENIIQNNWKNSFIREQLSSSHLNRKIQHFKVFLFQIFCQNSSLFQTQFQTLSLISIELYIFSICKFPENLGCSYPNLSAFLKINTAWQLFYGIHSQVQGLCFQIFRSRKWHFQLKFLIFALQIRKSSQFLTVNSINIFFTWFQLFLLWLQIHFFLL